MSLTLNKYQVDSFDTALYPDKGTNLTYPVLGLCGESGEVADKLKKMHRDDGGELTLERREGLIGELGDVLWYLSACATELNVTLEEVAQGNLDKLRSRLKRGVVGGDGDDR